MIIRLRDKTELTVSKEKGEKLSDLLMSGNCPDFIQINEFTIARSEITMIKPGGEYILAGTKLIEKGDYRNDQAIYEKARKKVGEIREELFKNVEQTKRVHRKIST
jgi:hypothetical protein